MIFFINSHDFQINIEYNKVTVIFNLTIRIISSFPNNLTTNIIHTILTTGKNLLGKCLKIITNSKNKL